MKDIRRRVKVTSDHILNGKANRATRCPVALAMNELVSPARTLVSLSRIDVLDENGVLLERYSVTRSARAFIKRFDKAELGNPQTFIFTGRKMVEEV